ncbi:MAG: glycosyltransferase family 9 protein [Candidatus Eisenbacteria sp.]|nr:glycosyltransferase family 9 protein [Candidatus Eisenbacteria bacterium]
MLRLSSVGDIVLTEPVVAALHEAYPAARIGFAVKKEFRDLVGAHPAISRVHVLDASSPRDMSAFGRDLRDAGYSAVVDLHRNMRTSRIVRTSGIPVRCSYRKRELGVALGVRLFRRPFRARKLLVRRYLDALGSIGMDAPTRAPRLYVSEADVDAGREFLRRSGVGREPFVAVVPGSVWATKRWPSTGYARLVAGLVSDLGLRVVLLGAPGERELCGDVAREAGAGVTNAAGEMTLGETAAVIAKGSLFIGNDSGPTHMAMALGVPSVALFGPTDPGQFDFRGHSLVYRDLECSACSFYGSERCHLGHWDCMQSIAPDDVLGAAAALLETGGADA